MFIEFIVVTYSQVFQTYAYFTFFWAFKKILENTWYKGQFSSLCIFIIFLKNTWKYFFLSTFEKYSYFVCHYYDWIEFVPICLCWNNLCKTSMLTKMSDLAIPPIWCPLDGFQHLHHVEFDVKFTFFFLKIYEITWKLSWNTSNLVATRRVMNFSYTWSKLI
jgi:hypothetical protein